ncbi:tRNA (adenosine(37)-N6)-dimethylallyltransferase MiaA [Compostimonas suwonensis]|uniref:tRNA dimethylallyltransferase n=1 Tax=Compostimonas suwonensis TaxID=1048394 RepID=A0A2M9BTS1_9MICO|nr:tRNA (adenosine(37)-N6)-dimethylallyltransferase MiaA [Compostimonas suwonensis]PJJ61335.1 tRNA dimethylallyltransferase [Compostimonas suwonensis]
MLVVIVGATGTGKSELSLRLAEDLAASGRTAEIVNADAMQLYRGMDIGTAKIPVDERRGIPHHMLDVLDVREESTVAAYQHDARAAIGDILGRGSVPVLVGGSGLYVSSVIYDFRFPGTDAAIRERLETELSERGTAPLHARLLELDPRAAQSIGPSNGRRLVRALEVIEITGEPHSASLPETPETWMPTTLLGLTAPRAELVARLDRRVEGMWEAGLLGEVETLIPQGIELGVTASRAIGYAQAIDELAGRSSREEAIAATAQLTRTYARRQVSWFKRYAHTNWLEYDDPRRFERVFELMGRNEPQLE